MQEKKESWTRYDLKQYLMSAAKWEIDDSGCKDHYRADGEFVSGFDEKGEATIGYMECSFSKYVRTFILRTNRGSCYYEYYYRFI